MAGDNVEAVRRLFRGWAEGDFRAATDLYDPEVEFTSDFGVDRVTARGLDAMRDAWRDHLRNWAAWRTGEIQEVHDLGDVVLVINSVHGRGRHSGAEVEVLRAAAAFRFRAGRIVWLLATDKVDDALKAVGLRE